MSTPRIKPDTTAVYHCISRIVSGDMRLDPHAKEVLRKMVRQVAGFSGVELLAYCLMTNHFHVLVRVRKDTPPSREEVLRRYRFLYEKSNTPGYPDADGMRRIFEGTDAALAEQWMARLTARMDDVSEFIKTLKQRFSLWYNKSRNHFGTVWAEKFKSVLIEDDPSTLKTVAAYLDLNPVRAKLVADPADYRWCSYAEAMGGDSTFGEGLARVMGCASWKEAAAPYRMVLFGKGGVARIDQGTIPEEVVKAVLKKGGKVEMCEMLRCRVRYFSDGAILGSEGFVRGMMEALIAGKSGLSGQSDQVDRESQPPKQLGQLDFSDGSKLCTLRRLQVAPISVSHGEPAS